MKKILVISQYFYPENSRVNDLSLELLKRGYQVKVITGIPNYPEGKFYNGYNLFHPSHEVWNGVEIVRLPLIPRGKNKFQLVLNYYSFMVSGWFWNLINNDSSDFLFTFQNSPLNMAMIGVWYKKKHNIPCYIYVQDLWPESVEIVGGIHNRLIINSINKMADTIYECYDRILVTSKSIGMLIEKRKHHIDQKKITYWPQYAEDFYVPLRKKSISEIPNDGSLNVVFTGNIGYAQGLDILPETAKLLVDEKVRFIIIGDGRYLPSLINEVHEKKVESMFVFIPKRPAQEIPGYLSACDVGFVSFMNNDFFKCMIPAKLQSYLACGVPIVAAAEGETKRIVEEGKCGICCPMGSPTKLAEAIQEIKRMDLSQLGANSRRYYETHFEKNKLMDQLEMMLSQEHIK